MKLYCLLFTSYLILLVLTFFFIIINRSAADIAEVTEWMDQIGKWSRTKKIPLFYGEFGCTTAQTEETGRYLWYKTHADQIRAHGWAAAVWDDDGEYRVFDRRVDTWDNKLLVALGKTPTTRRKGIDVAAAAATNSEETLEMTEQNEF